MNSTLALQDVVEPEGTCFGCGSKNPDGLRLKSRWDNEDQYVVAYVTPPACFMGWPGLVYGGFLAMLVDCHSNWTVIASHYRTEGRSPGTTPKINCVTGNLGVRYIKPTPMGVPLFLRGHVEGDVARKTRVICEIFANDELTAIGDSVFVRVDTARLAEKAHAHGG